MSERKVWVEKMPNSCGGCKYFAEHRRQCNLEICLQWSEDKFKFNDCPLHSIKDHDRELVKQVCEKIEDDFVHILNTNDGHFEYATLDDEFNIAIYKIQKEFEDGK